MGKKPKNKPTTINNIESVNVEIDYEKLAEAIVIAQEKAEYDKNKQDKSKNKFRAFFMRFFNWVIYFCIYMFALYLAYIGIHSEVKGIMENSVKVVLIIILLAVSIISFLLQFECFKDTVKEVREHFNTNLSFVALIVAIISLLIGVE